MKLVTFTYRGEVRIGAVSGRLIVDLNRAYDSSLVAQGVHRAKEQAAALVPRTMMDLLRGGEEQLEAARQALQFILDHSGGYDWRERGVIYELEEVRLLAPVSQPEKIICIGLNYADHAREANMPIPTEPVFFAKYTNSITHPGAPIILPKGSKQVDYEVEMVVVIGRRGKAVPVSEAYNFVAGYTIGNDVSARDYQFRTGQWTLGKTFDSFAPMGPYLVTKEEIPDPHQLRIELKLNGELMQSSNTSNMIFRVPELIAYLSELFTLEPGDVIFTGTPPGVGFSRQPPVFLRPGDHLCLEIEGLGVLENPVVKDWTLAKGSTPLKCA